VLGAVLTAGFAGSLPAGLPHDAARSLPDALTTAGPGAAHQVRRAFADSLTSSQLIGAVAVLLGGLLAAWLLSRVAPGPTADDGRLPGPRDSEPVPAG
jgi:hypothetical protein